MWYFIKIYLICIIGKKLAERKISQKNLEYMLNYSLPWDPVKIWAHFDNSITWYCTEYNCVS